MSKKLRLYLYLHHICVMKECFALYQIFAQFQLRRRVMHKSLSNKTGLTNSFFFSWSTKELSSVYLYVLMLTTMAFFFNCLIWNFFLMELQTFNFCQSSSWIINRKNLILNLVTIVIFVSSLRDQKSYFRIPNCHHNAYSPYSHGNE